MKQVLIRTEHTELVRGLSYEQRGKLLTLLLNTANDDNSQENDEILKEFASSISLLNVLMTLKSDVDNDKNRYESIVARNRANGAKGGRPRKNPKTQVKKTQETQKPKWLQGLTMLNHNDNNIIEREREREFPTLEDVLSAANQLLVIPETATRFFYYYDSLGWKVGDRPIVNWRSKLMEWKNNPKRFEQNANPNNSDEFHANRRRELAESAINAAQQSARGETADADATLL